MRQETRRKRKREEEGEEIRIARRERIGKRQTREPDLDSLNDANVFFFLFLSRSHRRHSDTQRGRQDERETRAAVSLLLLTLAHSLTLASEREDCPGRQPRG